MGCEGQDRFYAPTPRAVYEERSDDSKSAGVEEGVAERNSFWHADADIFCQPGWARVEQLTACGTGASEVSVVETTQQRPRPRKAALENRSNCPPERERMQMRFLFELAVRRLSRSDGAVRRAFQNPRH
jgi:hypothetical protein